MMKLTFMILFVMFFIGDKVLVRIYLRNIGKYKKIFDIIVNLFCRCCTKNQKSKIIAFSS